MEEEIKKENTSKSKKKIASINDGVIVKVKSGFYGTLYYRNLTSGETFRWEHAGDVQFMSMRDLRTMKAQQISFFKNQWIIILGVADGEDENITAEDIYKNLIVTQYYSQLVDPSSFAEAHTWSDSEIDERIGMLNAGSKENLIVALNKLIGDGKLDSIKKIKRFEKALACTLRNFD